MNITFLIGNGFDINLGLHTQYSSFLREYLKENPEDTDEIKKFKEDILGGKHYESKGSMNLWSNAEIALGRYTDEVVKQGKTAEVFFERYEDFCSKLAVYLEAQEARICIEGKEQSFIDAIQNFHTGLTENQEIDIKDIEANVGGAYVFNFIVFNYTTIIDKLVELIKKNKPNFGVRNNSRNSIGQVIHVHGTTKKDMILGVNDESQIANLDLFKDVSPIYISSFIKRETNQAIGSFVDEKTLDIINKSSCIYIYGMSLGKTDAIWWQRIIKRMKAQPNVRIIVYGFDAPKDDRLHRKQWIYNENKRRELLSFGGGDTAGLDSRIHVVSGNIFESFKDIAN